MPPATTFPHALTFPHKNFCLLAIKGGGGGFYPSLLISVIILKTPWSEPNQQYGSGMETEWGLCLGLANLRRWTSISL